MNIFIDTALFGCNIALFDETGVIAVEQRPIDRGYAEIILPMIENLLSSCGASAQDIEGIYCVIGPGSFTGLRVGLTVAQFMGFTLKKPIYGLSSFQAFSCGVKDIADGNRVVLVETKRSDFYVQRLDANHQPLGKEDCLNAQDIVVHDDDFITGDAVERFLQETGRGNDVTLAQKMIDLPLIIDEINAGRLEYHDARALYIRDADVSTPKKGKR